MDEAKYPTRESTSERILDIRGDLLAKDPFIPINRRMIIVEIAEEAVAAWGLKMVFDGETIV